MWSQDPFDEREDQVDWLLAELRVEYGSVRQWEFIATDEWLRERFATELLRAPDYTVAIWRTIDAVHEHVIAAYLVPFRCEHQLALPLAVAA